MRTACSPGREVVGPACQDICITFSTRLPNGTCACDPGYRRDPAASGACVFAAPATCPEGQARTFDGTVRLGERS